MPEVVSLNVFLQPTSQFEVLETVPDVIQQVAININQRDTTRITSTVAVENTDQAKDTDLIPPTPDTLSVNNVHPATSGLASTSTTTPIEAPQTSDAFSNARSRQASIPATDAIPTGTSQSTSPAPTDPTMSASTSAPDYDCAAFKALNTKRYLHKAKMVPGVSVTAR